MGKYEVIRKTGSIQRIALSPYDRSRATDNTYRKFREKNREIWTCSFFEICEWKDMHTDTYKLAYRNTSQPYRRPGAK